LAATKLSIIIICSLLCASLGSALINSIAAVNTQPVGWQEDFNLTKGLPPLGRIGENHQCFIYNLNGDGQWNLIVVPSNSWTINQFPFTGYDWDGSRWVNNDAIVKGLVAYANENDPPLAST